MNILSNEEALRNLTNNGSVPENRLRNVSQSQIAEYFEQNRYLIYLLKNAVASTKFPAEIRQSFGHNKSEFFMDLTFARHTVSDELVTHFYDLNNGNCFKFNSGVASNGSVLPLVRQTNGGKNHGLFMVLFADVFNNEINNFLDYDTGYGMHSAQIARTAQ
jgi:hypothetical protein